MDEREAEQRPKAEKAVRKPYERPRLIEYGSIAKLTQGTATVGADSGPTGMNQQCL
ncbi:MAG TPA: lasso RiPP family leader peptide-containing protein [Methylomirabilota bacterium]|nr:lasso RiPP family leader peptide-containing protein [Methylomirabilota bacterium]